jgi:hypothetical protein
MVVGCGLGWARGQISVNTISLKVWDFVITLELSVSQEFWSIFHQFAVRLMDLRSGDEFEHRSYPFHGLDIVRPLEF